VIPVAELRSARWSGVSAAYRESFAGLCVGTVDRILDELGGGRGRTLIDVGCGTGTLAFRAAHRGWTVVALDSDPDMVTSTAAAAGGLPIVTAQAALPALSLTDGCADSAVANFVINHVPDPRAAVVEMARVVRPGGRVAVTIWTNKRTALAEVFSESLQAAGAVIVAGHRLPADKDFERTAAGLGEVTRGAGLEPQIEAEIHWDWIVRWKDLWRGIAGGVASIGETYRAQPVEVRARIEAEMRTRVLRLERNGSLVIPSTAAYVVARKPRSPLIGMTAPTAA
jgi:ubiquinone/menaquinone biosynthesis C-methylase UbiE